MQFVKPLNEIGAMPNLLRGFKHMQAEMLYVKPLDELGALPILLRGFKKSCRQKFVSRIPYQCIYVQSRPLDGLGATPNLLRGFGAAIHACSSYKSRGLLPPVTRAARTRHACLLLQVTRGWPGGTASVVALSTTLCQNAARQSKCRRTCAHFWRSHVPNNPVHLPHQLPSSAVRLTQRPQARGHLPVPCRELPPFLHLCFLGEADLHMFLQIGNAFPRCKRH